MPNRPTPPQLPMKWVVVSIVVFIVLYTAVNIYFRKPAPPHRPYEELVNRTTTARLLAGGWHRLPTDTRRPFDKPSGGDTLVNRGPVGIGGALGECFVEKQPLLASIDKVAAPGAVTRGEPCQILFTGSVPDQQLQLGDVLLYQRGTEIVLVPLTEHLPGQRLLSRWPDAHYGVSFPTSALTPGTYQVRIVARGPAMTWTLVVK